MSRGCRVLKSPCSLCGVGLHSGVETEVRILPADPGTGLVFRRVDLPGAPELRLPDILLDAPPFRSALRRDGIELHTVEHLLAALTGLGIYDAAVEVNGPEIPGMDGSALPFVEAVLGAGIEDRDGGRAPIRLRTAASVSDGRASIAALPARGGLSVSYSLMYPGEPLAQGDLSIVLDEKTFREQIAPARTFCLLEEAERLRAAGFGKGASTRNTLVLDRGKVLGNELRFPDEPVRHKILDLIGDLAFLGRPLEAEVIARRSGHRLNRLLTRRILNGGAGTAGNDAFAAAGAAVGPETAAGTVDTGRVAGAVRGEMVPTRAGGTGKENMERPPILDIEQIAGILPHRYPFLLVDRILAMEPMKRVVAIKNVTMNEGFFQGHFPGRPIMPGVLIIEALAQAAAVLFLRDYERKGALALLAGLDGVKFRRKVVPGDQLVLDITIERLRLPFGIAKGTASVEGEVAAEAVIKFAISDEGGGSGGGRSGGEAAERGAGSDGSAVRT
ncbi:MAG: UDP-3-O-acyl-N-acetylglucosamine deacetylase [Planctomycetota bacterium]|nr:UDP-3-O-acyl-N-acetylglucosamine deacetylase [Planctomycetota bacterium]